MIQRPARLALAAALALGGLGTLAATPGGLEPSAQSGEALTVVTHVDVLPPATDAGRALLRAYAASARSCPGATRVEVVEELGRPNHSTILSTWTDRAAFDAHLAAEPTRDFRTKLQPLLGSPFDERLHRVVRP